MVIAIIAILAAILFPVFARARENARKATCTSNMKQLGLSFHMYIQDFDSTYPLPDADGAGVSWARRIQPYVKNLQVFYCPSDRHDPQGPANPDGIKYLCTYGYNYNMGHDAAAGWALRLITESALQYASSTCVLFESKDYFMGYPGSSYDTIQQPEWAGGFYWNAGQSRGSAPGWHMEGDIILFADGHAKWVNTKVVRDGGGFPYSTSTLTFAP